MLGALLQADFADLIAERRWDDLREAAEQLDPADLAAVIIELSEEDEAILFRLLPRAKASAAFSCLPFENQETLIQSLTSEQTRGLIEGMSPDDRIHLLDELPAEVMRRLLEALPPDELRATRELLGYPPESAGRYMTPRYVEVRPEMTAAEALSHVRRTAAGKETLHMLYVVGQDGRLIQDLPLSSLVLAPPERTVLDIEERPLVAIPATTDREDAVRAFEKYDRYALPVIDSDGHMLGIITADDILDVATAEATEDIQKIGGVEALNARYLEVPFLEMIRKRAGWLSILFVGEMLTTTAMAHFEHEIAKAVVLAMFIPLIISSGGNTGSQASTLVVRALALNELRLRDWWSVCWREASSGLTLGMWLGFLGFLRVVIWQRVGWFDFGEHAALIGVTVWASLLGVVAFGTLAGSMLPFVLRRLGFDPATSSTPFVATLVDVSGLLIYFGVASVVLSGALL